MKRKENKSSPLSSILIHSVVWTTGNQPFIYSIYFNRELKESNDKRQVILVEDQPHLKFLH